MKRIIMGFVWFIVLYFGILAFGGGLAGAIEGAKAGSGEKSFNQGFNQGYQAGYTGGSRIQDQVCIDNTSYCLWRGSGWHVHR